MIVSALQAANTTEGAANAAACQENKALLHTLESTVFGNKQKIFGQCAYLEENRSLILKNYSAAFMGNRLMANQNTDDIFRNRTAILKNTKVADSVQVNFADATFNKARIDYIEHCSKMNAKVVGVNEKMAIINTMLTEVNNNIMEGNAE